MVGAEVRLLGFHHVQLAMPSGEEARADAFYAGILGLQRVEKPESLWGRGGCWFRDAGVEVHLGVEDPFRPARKAHPAFLVEGLDALRHRFEEAGIEVDEQPPLAGYRRFHTFDPFGNRLEVLERSAET
jgi:catechol 2,3-dioxygenase-like lactoylglutathione lyase family enzyme